MTKRLLILPLAIAGLAACSDSNTITTPSVRPSAELVAGGIARENANIEIVATFTHTITGGTAYRPVNSPGINDEGREIGTCLAGGAWRNPAGKIVGARPHSHCITVAPSLQLTLEPIPGRHQTYCFGSCGNANRRLADKVTFDAASTMWVQYNRESNNDANWRMQGTGIILAHAVDQDGNRYGTFTFDLGQYGRSDNVDLFDSYVNIGTEESPLYVWGLELPIAATFTAPDGSTTAVSGYVYWSEIE